MIDSAGIITLPSGIMFVYTYTRLFTNLIGLGIHVFCTVEGSFNHNRLVAVERREFLIIYVDKKTEGPSVTVGSDEHGDI